MFFYLFKQYCGGTYLCNRIIWVCKIVPFCNTNLYIFHSTPYRLLIFSIGIFCIFSRCYNFDFRIHARINLQFRPSRQMATVWIVLFISWNVLDFMALQGICPFLNSHSCDFKRGWYIFYLLLCRYKMNQFEK